MMVAANEITQELQRARRAITYRCSDESQLSDYDRGLLSGIRWAMRIVESEIRVSEAVTHCEGVGNTAQVLHLQGDGKTNE